MMASLFGIWVMAQVAACSSLSPLVLGVCGNNVVEPSNGEECDGYSQGENTSCNGSAHNHRCRFDCLSKAKGGEGFQCPDGLRCGADGVCRRPSGNFLVSGSVDQAPGDWVAMVDVDGNGVDDLVSAHTQHLSTVFLGLGDQGAGQHVFMTPITSNDRGHPAVGDLDSDGYGDVILSEKEGLSVLRGSPLKTLEPSTYLTYALPGDAQSFVAIDLAPNTIEGLSTTYYGAEGIVVSGKYLLSMIDPPLTSFMHEADDPSVKVKLPESANQLVARPIVAQLDESTETAELLLAFRDILLIFVPKVRIVAGSLVVDLDQRPDINVPDGAKINNRGVFAFVNTDGHVDLLLSTDKGLYFADGNGDGNFAKPIIPNKLSGECNLPTDSLLAAADLDGDLFPDFVFAKGIVLSSHDSFCKAGQLALRKPGNGSWTNAVIADFNDDGRTDLVAASSDTAGVDFYNGTDSGLLNHSKLATANKIDHLTAGDFDGDNLLDLAMVELEVDGLRDGLSIAFGVPAGPPTTVTPIGALYEISDVSATNMAKRDEDFVDGINDLVVVAQYPSDSGQVGSGFALLFGRPDRQLQSPFPVLYEVGNNNDLRYSPYTAVVTNSSLAAPNAAAARAVVSVGYRVNKALNAPDIALSVTSASEDATLSTFGAPTDTELTEMSAARLVGLMTAVDIDGDGAEEHAMLVGSRDEQGLSLRVGVTDQEKGSVLRPVASLADVTLLGFRFGSNDPVTEGPEKWSTKLHNRLQPCLLEEEAKEPALLFAVVERSPEGEALATAVYVVRNATLNALLAAIQSGPLVFERVPAPQGETLLGFSCVDTDGQGGKELALLTVTSAEEDRRARIHLFGVGEQGVQLQSEAHLELDALQLPVLSQQTVDAPLVGLTRGDINGDGIDDLVVFTHDETLLVEGLPVIP